MLCVPRWESGEVIVGQTGGHVKVDETIVNVAYVGAADALAIVWCTLGQTFASQVPVEYNDVERLDGNLDRI